MFCFFLLLFLSARTRTPPPQKFCFYGGLHYNIAHAALSLWAERSLQMIDPSVSLAYWDFTRETSELGAK